MSLSGSEPETADTKLVLRERTCVQVIPHTVESAPKGSRTGHSQEGAQGREKEVFASYKQLVPMLWKSSQRVSVETSYKKRLGRLQ